MIHFVDLDIVARGGGGGSGGGGGGGGGLLALISYVPAYYGCKFIKKFTKGSGAIVGCCTWILLLCIAYSLLLFKFSPLLTFILIALAVFGGYSGYFDLHQRLSGRIKKSKQDATQASLSDKKWNYDDLIKRVQDVYAVYQDDWSNFNLKSIADYTTPHFYYHNQLMLAAMHLRHRQNLVNNPQLLQADIIEVNDNPDNNYDYFIAYINGKANDQLIDTESRDLLYTDNNPFDEYWRFERINDSWMLAKIDQATANPSMKQQQLEAFAAEQGFCYNLDWGWLLLPKRGQVFSRGGFGISDINNHVIGVYNNVLIELYTYQPNPKNNTTDQYVIAQTSVPKNYGNIVVRNKKSSSIWSKELFNSKPKGLTKLSTEWGDFNKKYDLFASDAELATSFELLNPKYMEQLEAVPFDVSIEVVDNVVYLYSKNLSADYATMLELLKAAFKEMKM